ncbi:MAG: hypothetical protein VB093_10170 [Propionicimonas sp.]|nr:hypothetical protein [Propionicimonas sp.]NLI86178.1 hypothetical protein [Propionibacterium sp.]
MTDAEVRVIACDESASEGENLIASRHPVFVHASVNLTMEDAVELLDAMRVAMHAQAPEMKSKTALAPSNRPALMDALERLSGAANICLVDKAYFLTSKLIALLIAAQASEEGMNIGELGYARDYADYLDQNAAEAVGSDRWDAVLGTYNRLIRSYQRENAEPPTAEPFFAALNESIRHCTDEKTRRLLLQLWRARHFAHEYEGASKVELRELDPLPPTMTAVARTWAMRLSDTPFELLADTYSVLTPEVCQAIVNAARSPLTVRDNPQPVPDLRRVSVSDSRSDARIQIADVLAGVGREVARLAMDGTFDDDLQVAVHEMLDINIMASTGSPLDVLVDRRPLPYCQDWTAEHWGV